MTACSSGNDLGDWMPGSICAPGDFPGKDGEIQVVMGERRSSKRPLTMEERRAALEKIILSQERSTRANGSQARSTSSRSRQSSQPHVEKAVRAGSTNVSDTSDTDSYSWDVVKIKSGDEMSTLSSGESACRKWRWICIALLLVVLIAVAVTVPLVLKKDDNRTSNTSASNVFTNPPTAAPTAALNLPSECMSSFNSVDLCLLVDLTEDEADSCIDCVWRYLPSREEPCQNLEMKICDVVRSCRCSSCEDELIEYLDCQTDCEIYCEL